ncbi:MAG: hypothetical protein OEN23_12835 [Paracoccaceae bacterium]|nr:hypothetical protein [Paracoccaceae bacterium]
MKTTFKGTGLTEVKDGTITPDDNAASLKDPAEGLSNPSSYWTLREALDATVAAFREELDERGLPSDETRQVTRLADGTWEDAGPVGIPSETIGESNAYLASAFVKASCEYDSMDWYMAEAIHRAWQMKKIDATEDDRIEAAMRLARIVERAGWNSKHQEAALAGYRVFEGRELGRKEAQKAHRRATMKKRRTIIKAAKQLYADDPKLERNDSETARKIEAMWLPELLKGKGNYLSPDRIRAYIADARRSGEL